MEQLRAELAPLAERWRPFFEALFAAGVYASLSCYRRAHPSARTYREVAVVAASMLAGRPRPPRGAAPPHWKEKTQRLG